MTHVLKCYPGPFIEFKRGRTHDFRRDDRGFKEDDRILYQDYNPADQRQTGDEMMFRITHVTRGGKYGIPPGFVVMSVAPVTIPTHVRGDLEESRRRMDRLGTNDL